MKRLNLDYLNTFVMVAEHGSFSAAADRLGLTQPAISLQVRQLEQSVGATLIERVGRVARPTLAGEALLAHAAQIEDAVTAATDAVTRRGAGGGRVRIGTGATACLYVLPPILKTLRQTFPGLDLTVTTGNTVDIVQAIEDNRLDIGLVTLPVTGRSLEITPVLVDEFMLAAPADMLLPKRVNAASLADKPVLLFEPGGHTRTLSDAWFARSRVPVRPVMSLGSVEAIKALVAAGLGCAVLPGLALGTSTRKDLTVHTLHPKLQRTLATVVRRDKRVSAGLAQLLRALQGLSKPDRL